MKRPEVPGGGRPVRAARLAPSRRPGGTSRVTETRGATTTISFRPVRQISDAPGFSARSRRRRLSWLLGAGTIVGVALLVTGIVMSPLLTLTDIVVKGRENVPERVIVGAASDQIGRPLASLDFEAIGDRLSTVTRIQSFTTEIQPPHTLVIRIVERQAVGYIAVKGKWSIVDAAGVVIETVSAVPGRLPLIVVSATTDRAFSAITETLTAWPASQRKNIASISAETRDSVEITLRGVGHRIVWGSPDNSALKLVVMDRALDVADTRLGRYEIDVSAPDNIVLQPVG